MFNNHLRLEGAIFENWNLKKRKSSKRNRRFSYLEVAFTFFQYFLFFFGRLDNDNFIFRLLLHALLRVLPDQLEFGNSWRVFGGFDKTVFDAQFSHWNCRRWHELKAVRRSVDFDDLLKSLKIAPINFVILTFKRGGRENNERRDRFQTVPERVPDWAKSALASFPPSISALSELEAAA